MGTITQTHQETQTPNTQDQETWYFLLIKSGISSDKVSPLSFAEYQLPEGLLKGEKEPGLAKLDAIPPPLHQCAVTLKKKSISIYRDNLWLLNISCKLKISACKKKMLFYI